MCAVDLSNFFDAYITIRIERPFLEIVNLELICSLWFVYSLCQLHTVIVT